MSGGASPPAPPSPGPAVALPAPGPTSVGPKPPELPAFETVALAPEIPFRAPPVRAVIGLLVIFVVLGGVAYPLAVDGFARGTGGFNAVGGFVAGGNAAQLAELRIGENITNESLFWLRPSLDDYNTTLESGEEPFGPTDPNLVNLTRYYIGVYGLNNTTAPIELVSPSESGLDPDLDPAAALVQIPRISLHTNLSEAYLTSFVQAHVEEPVLGIFGAPVVNVLQLDFDLIDLLHDGGGG